MREVVREHLDSIKPGWDCLLIAKKKTAEAQYRDVEDAILGLLKQGKLLVTTESRD